MVAATLNAMAVTFTGKAKLTLTSADNKSCTLGIGESEDLAAGLNNGYYAELNTEGKEVQLYVTYGGVNYQSFSSNAATMQDLQLGIKTNASTAYTLTASNVTGRLKVKINGVTYDITAGMSEAITLPANATLPAAGDEANYKVQPSTPLVKGICFNYNVLTLTKYAGETVEVYNYGTTTAALTQAIAADAATDVDLNALAAGKYLVKVGTEEYVIDVKPAVTVVP